MTELFVQIIFVLAMVTPAMGVINLAVVLAAEPQGGARLAGPVRAGAGPQ
jgi:hypothetical protein